MHMAFSSKFYPDLVTSKRQVFNPMTPELVIYYHKKAGINQKKMYETGIPDMTETCKYRLQ